MDSLKKELPHKIKTLLPYWVILSVALIIAGICCLSLQSTATEQNCTDSTKYEYETKLELNYANCRDDLDDERTCSSQDVATTPCSCSQLLRVPKDIIGDVLIFYRLDTFNESDTVKKDNFFQSRDNDQLRGMPKETPSAACKPYDYDENNRTVLPCGAIADAMFNDTISIYKDSVFLPLTSYGIIREEFKEGFHNPNNITALQNFSKPKSWKKNVWELDTTNEQNNGLQNEAFIAWMHTDWAEKPMLRLDRTSDENGGVYKNGLPAGNYTLTVTYNYPYSRYQGNRTIIVKREYSEPVTPCFDILAVSETGQKSVSETGQKSVSYGVGVAALIFGIVFLLLGVAAALSFFVTERRRMASTKMSSDPPNIEITPSVITSASDKSDNESTRATKPKEEEILLNKAPKAVENNEEYL